MTEYSIRWTHMEITKDELRILRYIYSKRTISFKKLKEHFQKYSNISEIIRNMLADHYITIISGIDKPILGDSIPNSCILTMTRKGAAMVEGNQWFNGQFVLLQIVLPIVIAIITTLITIFLSA